MDGPTGPTARLGQSLLSSVWALFWLWWRRRRCQFAHLPCARCPLACLFALRARTQSRRPAAAHESQCTHNAHTDWCPRALCVAVERGGAALAGAAPPAGAT